MVRKTGTIVSWKSERGFGFIEPSEGGRQPFVHIKSLDRALLPPAVGAEVSYIASADPQGRPRAERVKPIRDGFRIGPAMNAFMTASLFLMVLTVISILGIVPLEILWLYLGASFLSFIVYKLDKMAAQRGGQRTPENTLHLLALIGGWPGALYAQQLLRHKSSKESFRFVFWITVLLNLAALGTLVSGHGTWLVKLVEGLAGS
jgi:uncharacterized membrane protein YsdA (DUF1294 family)/cold shock CspA family protein